MKTKRLGLGISLCAAALFFGPFGIELIMALQVAPVSFLAPVATALLSLSFVFPLVWLAIALASPILAIAAAFKTKFRIYLTTFIIVWLVSWLSVPLAWSLKGIRNPGLKRMAQQAKPLIEAIESFHEKQGRYPEDLSELVPKFLPKIPSTGASGYREFKYSFANDRSLFQRYELLVRTPTGGINWDVFVFWPEKNYPTNMYGGSLLSGY